ncbi:hypothetical protein BDD12DRAFT_888468 [Trichophaea hybrida]|nr:hypothetical protein BDD12DRAFT_888468 [Trichophaea hybrida]
MCSSRSFQSGYPQQVDKQAFFEKLQSAKFKMKHEVISSTSTTAPIDSQTSTDHGRLPSLVPTTPSQTNFGCFPTDVPTRPTQETNYRWFPGGVADIDTEEMDHEDTEPAVQADDTKTEEGDDSAEQDQQGTADFSHLSSLESTTRQLPCKPRNMFN